MKYKKILLICIFFCNLAIQLNATSHHKQMTPIPEDALFSLKHYYKFYGDANTIYGRFFERSQVLGSMSGLRNALVDHGIYLDTCVDLFYGFNTTGGANKDILRHSGIAEYWFVLDTAKNNMWPNGAFMLHAETSWEFSVNGDAGSLVAANDSATKPVRGKSTTTLSEVVLEQIIRTVFTFRIGKLDAIGPLDDNNFANNSRFQFLNTGLVNNPIILTFIPHTLLGVFGMWTPSDLHTIKMFVGDINGRADKSGFQTLFDGENTYVFQYQFTPKINQKLPGNYRVIICVFDKEITNYAVNPRVLAGQNITNIPIDPQSINYALLLGFDQYVWVDDIKNSAIDRQGQGQIGVGLFGRAGWAPQDRNVISQFYSIGIGGYGMPGTKRYYDFWGIGYTATKISKNLREDLLEKNISFNAYEHAVEAFYNLELGPWVHVQFDAQVVKPPLKTRNTAFVLQTRFRFDF